MIDIKEFEIPDNVLKVLLKDHTTGMNILCVTDQYGYSTDSHIDIGQIISVDAIKPRVLKSQEEKKYRTDTKAEVFTPYEIVRKMNDQVERDLTDMEYICSKVLEVTCGEAPFLATRYHMDSGEEIPVTERTGLLDRKLDRIKASTSEEWCRMADLCLKSTYGYEWQADSLFLARENLLLDVVEHHRHVFGSVPEERWLKQWAHVISWNVIRMDGISMCVPETEIPAMVMDWESNKKVRFDGKEEEKGLW